MLECAGDGGDDVRHGADEHTLGQFPGVSSIENKDQGKVRKNADLQQFAEGGGELPAESLERVPQVKMIHVD